MEKKQKKMNKEINLKGKKGITLIALIVTIIVLLILAGVTIATLTGDNGLLQKATNAKELSTDGEIEEQIKLAYLEWKTAKLSGTAENANDYIKKILNTSIGNIEEVLADDNAVTVNINKNNEEKVYYYNVPKGTIKQIELAKNSTNKNDSYVGCYADIDEDGIVDGIIFADLLTGSIRDTQEWGSNGNGKYTLPINVIIENVKKYYISQERYTDSHFGTHPVISPIAGGEERFYVMQLNDFTTPAYVDENDSLKNYPAYTVYYFYKNAFGHMSPMVTLDEFGTGKENTGKMIAKWNEAGTQNGYTDSLQDNQDILKHIQEKYKQSWFIPSKAEWSAFANELGTETPVTTSSCGLSKYYWTSSQVVERNFWYADLQPNQGIFYYYWAQGAYAVRLATTF